MDKKILVGILVVVTSLVGVIWVMTADRMQFTDVILNKNLPNDYRTRVLWRQTDAFKYDISQLAGHVIAGNKETGNFSRGRRCLRDGFKPTLEIIDSGTIYNSKIDRSASSKGEYFGFAGNLDAKQAAEVTIADSARVFVPWDQIPIDDLAIEASKPLEMGEEGYYIQGVVLASVTIRTYAEVGIESAINGEAFGAKGKIYSEKSDVIKDYQISLTLLSLHELGLKNFSAGQVESTIVPANFVVRSLK